MEATLTLADLTRLAALIEKAGGIDQLQKHLGMLAGGEEGGELNRTIPSKRVAGTVEGIS